MILLSIDVTDLTFEKVIVALAVFIVAWFVVKNFLEMKSVAKNQIEREQGWDNAAKVIKEKEAKWDKGLADIYEERVQIVERFDTKLADLEDKMLLIQTENDAKIQELKADIVIVLKGQKACLDGLVEQGCNGPVREARDDLSDFLVNKV